MNRQTSRYIIYTIQLINLKSIWFISGQQLCPLNMAAVHWLLTWVTWRYFGVTDILCVMGTNEFFLWRTFDHWDSISLCAIRFLLSSPVIIFSVIYYYSIYAMSSWLVYCYVFCTATVSPGDNLLAATLYKTGKSADIISIEHQTGVKYLYSSSTQRCIHKQT